MTADRVIFLVVPVVVLAVVVVLGRAGDLSLGQRAAYGVVTAGVWLGFVYVRHFLDDDAE